MIFDSVLVGLVLGVRSARSTLAPLGNVRVFLSSLFTAGALQAVRVVTMRFMTVMPPSHSTVNGRRDIYLRIPTVSTEGGVSSLPRSAGIVFCMRKSVGVSRVRTNVVMLYVRLLVLPVSFVNKVVSGPLLRRFLVCTRTGVNSLPQTVWQAIHSRTNVNLIRPGSIVFFAYVKRKPLTFFIARNTPTRPPRDLEGPWERTRKSVRSFFRKPQILSLSMSFSSFRQARQNSEEEAGSPAGPEPGV